MVVVVIVVTSVVMCRGGARNELGPRLLTAAVKQLYNVTAVEQLYKVTAESQLRLPDLTVLPPPIFYPARSYETRTKLWYPEPSVSPALWSQSAMVHFYR